MTLAEYLRKNLNHEGRVLVEYNGVSMIMGTTKEIYIILMKEFMCNLRVVCFYDVRETIIIKVIDID